MTGRAHRKKEAEQLVTFSVGKDIYAIEILKIQEVVNFRKIKHTSDTPKFIEGTIELRNSTIPVMDLKKRMGIREQVQVKGKQRIIVLKLDERLLGVIVDDFSKVFHVDNTHYEPIPEDILANQDMSYTERVAKTDQGVIVVISPERILTRHEHEALKKFEARYD